MLKDKLSSTDGPLLLYGITPPKKGVSYEKALEIANKHKDRISGIKLDGFVIYDLQDEKERTSKKRIFDYFETLNPQEYHAKFLNEYEAVIYKVVGKYSPKEFENFIKNANSQNPYVFVGASSNNEQNSLTLQDSYKITKNLRNDLTIGGICIPERHHIKGNEDLRVARKTTRGCEFFITQAVYDLTRAMSFLDDYSKLGIKKKRIVFTLTPCGSPKTLEFMKWLGIYISKDVEQLLLDSNDMLEKSLILCLEIFKLLNSFAKSRDLSIGVNIESISARKVEIDASARLLKKISQMLY
ncbi:MAG: 5,10-methylenetetrahydrofolate reductase [Campylobacter sp.]|nr:5,10-methylenetetrahydrofolate reductase [Campylobacter sp.]